MLSIAVLAFATVLQTPSAPPQPPTPDWRYEFTLRPQESTLTSTWRCGEPDQPSMAKVSVVAFRDAQKRQLFRVSLVSLRVKGRPVDQRTFRSVARKINVLESINIHGRCRGKSEYLLVTGSEFDGASYSPRTLELSIN